MVNELRALAGGTTASRRAPPSSSRSHRARTWRGSRREHDVDLCSWTRPTGCSRTPACSRSSTRRRATSASWSAARRDGPVVVPFAGAEHDWAAVELGAWLARSHGATLRLAGAATGADGRDASRLLAHASIAVQRALGVPAEPVLVEPEPEALVDGRGRRGLVVVGLTDRWRRDGLGQARTALATHAAAPTCSFAAASGPGGLAPRGSETRFTWTIAG